MSNRQEADNLEDLAIEVLDPNNPFVDRDDIPYTEETVTDPNTGRERTRRHYAVVDVVNYWMERKNASYIYNKNTAKVDKDGERIEISIDGAHRSIILHADKSRIALSQTKSLLALSEWWETKREEVTQSYREKLAYSGANPFEIAKPLIEIWTGTPGELDAVAIIHFIWQVKRKLNKLKAVDHFMPILVGLQGGGKSEAVRQFIKPINELSADLPDLRQLVDERQYGLLHNNYVLFADEMGRSEKVPTDLLKSVISGEFLRQRIMRTTEHTTLTQNATLIGAANHNLRDIIYDTSGMRRYWQISCKKRLDWDAVNNFDYLSLWRAVNENGPSPLQERKDEIYKIQDTELRSKTTIEQFIGSEDLITYAPPDAENPGDWINADDIYSDYVGFCTKQKLAQPLSMTKFFPHLQAHYPTILKRRMSRGNQYLIVKL